jgi:thioredoxin reductase (NADPH)
MASPVLLIVDDDAQALAALEQALQRRYGADYQLRAERSPAAALRVLERLGPERGPVGLVIADLWMPETTGVDLLAQARHLQPSARRLLLIDAMDRRAAGGCAKGWTP